MLKIKNSPLVFNLSSIVIICSYWVNCIWDVVSLKSQYIKVVYEFFIFISPIVVLLFILIRSIFRKSKGLKMLKEDQLGFMSFLLHLIVIVLFLFWGLQQDYGYY
jgi:hypothetical protein